MPQRAVFVCSFFSLYFLKISSQWEITEPEGIKLLKVLDVHLKCFPKEHTHLLFVAKGPVVTFRVLYLRHPVSFLSFALATFLATSSLHRYLSYTTEKQCISSSDSVNTCLGSTGIPTAS
jgi:hypothetical protein